jgi:hypothetical protein
MLLFSALSGLKFAIQINRAYFKGWSVSLQYMLIPAVGMYKGTTGTMKNNPVINQWIPTYSTIHLVTPYCIIPDLSVGVPGSP